MWSSTWPARDASVSGCAASHGPTSPGVTGNPTTASREPKNRANSRPPSQRYAAIAARVGCGRRNGGRKLTQAMAAAMPAIPMRPSIAIEGMVPLSREATSARGSRPMPIATPSTSAVAVGRSSARAPSAPRAVTGTGDPGVALGTAGNVGRLIRAGNATPSSVPITPPTRVEGTGSRSLMAGTRPAKQPIAAPMLKPSAPPTIRSTAGYIPRTAEPISSTSGSR